MRYFEGFKTPLNNFTKTPAFFAIIFHFFTNFFKRIEWTDITTTTTDRIGSPMKRLLLSKRLKTKKISQKANLIMMNVAFFLNGFFVKVCSIEDKQRSHEWRGKDKRWPLATWTNEMVGISLLSSTNEQTLGRSLHSF